MKAPIACCLLATMSILVLAATASGEGIRDTYQSTYERVDRENAGPYAGGVAGRNLADDGVLAKDGARRATAAELEDGIAVMERMLVPPAPAPEPVAAASPAAAPAPVAASTGGTIPSYISDCESGGDYGAVNPSSGAYGKYQIIPSTAAAYGCDLSTPAGQDQCAGEIYADVGSSAWSCG